VMKGKLKQLHALERAVLSQQQQLMQIVVQTQRVNFACLEARKDRAQLLRECTLHQRAEEQHRRDAEDLKGRIQYTKVSSLHSSALANHCTKHVSGMQVLKPLDSSNFCRGLLRSATQRCSRLTRHTSESKHGMRKLTTSFRLLRGCIRHIDLDPPTPSFCNVGRISFAFSHPTLPHHPQE
jgi:hypothetical protein